jgi:hypothetical protein
MILRLNESEINEIAKDFVGKLMPHLQVDVGSITVMGEDNKIITSPRIAIVFNQATITETEEE